MKAVAHWFGLGLGLFLLSLVSLRYIAGERAGLLEDDSYFYAQIAFNFQKLGIFSFDSVNPTSGFHLLWGGILALFAKLVGFFTQDKAAHLAAYFAFWTCFLAALGSRVGRTPLQKIAFVGIGLLTAPLMETALLSLLLILVAERIETAEQMEASHDERLEAAKLSALCALVPLTRIDAGLVLVLWLPLLWRRPLAFRALFVGLAVGVFVHFGILRVAFGHFHTVSSVLKAAVLSRGPQIIHSLCELGILVRFLLLMLLTFWGGIAQWGHSRRTDWKRTLLWFAPVTFTLMHVFLSDVRSWYFLPGFAFSFWAGSKNQAAQGKASWVARLPQPLWCTVFAVTLVLSGYKLYRFIPLAPVRVGSWEFVAELREKVPRSGRVYQIDGSGFTGFWSERALFNGDGLVNTYEYASRMKAKKLDGYLDENNICYIITDAPLLGPKRPLVRKGGLSVRKNEAVEVLRSSAYGWSKNKNAHFILWKLKKPRCRIRATSPARPHPTRLDAGPER